jgi:hypothetical protein
VEVSRAGLNMPVMERNYEGELSHGWELGGVLGQKSPGHKPPGQKPPPLSRSNPPDHVGIGGVTVKTLVSRAVGLGSTAGFGIFRDLFLDPIQSVDAEWTLNYVCVPMSR